VVVAVAATPFDCCVNKSKTKRGAVHRRKEGCRCRHTVWLLCREDQEEKKRETSRRKDNRLETSGLIRRRLSRPTSTASSTTNSNYPLSSWRLPSPPHRFILVSTWISNAGTTVFHPNCHSVVVLHPSSVKNRERRKYAAIAQQQQRSTLSVLAGATPPPLPTIQIPAPTPATATTSSSLPYLLLQLLLLLYQLNVASQCVVEKTTRNTVGAAKGDANEP
jgi:hypothetical protein